MVQDSQAHEGVDEVLALCFEREGPQIFQDIFQDNTGKNAQSTDPPIYNLLRGLWPLLDGIWAVLMGSFSGVLVVPRMEDAVSKCCLSSSGFPCS